MPIKPALFSLVLLTCNNPIGLTDGPIPTLPVPVDDDPVSSRIFPKLNVLRVRSDELNVSPAWI